jgi:four helix bundle protein
MSKVARFEDLVAWQRARALTQSVYEVTRQGTLANDRGLAGQMQRAAVSTMSNIAEGFERSGLAEFHQFLSTAKASCAELRSQLYVAFDVGHLDQPTFERLLARGEEVARLTGSLRAAVQRRRDQRRKKA